MVSGFVLKIRSGANRPESVLKEVKVDFTVNTSLKPNDRKASAVNHASPSHALRSRRLVALNDFVRRNRSPDAIVLHVGLRS